MLFRSVCYISYQIKGGGDNFFQTPISFLTRSNCLYLFNVVIDDFGVILFWWSYGQTVGVVWMCWNDIWIWTDCCSKDPHAVVFLFTPMYNKRVQPQNFPTNCSFINISVIFNSVSSFLIPKQLDNHLCHLSCDFHHNHIRNENRFHEPLHDQVFE